MESSAQPANVLILANKTAAAPHLLDAVRERAAQGPCRFTLVVPTPTGRLEAIADREDADPHEGDEVLELALPALEEAAGGPVEGRVGDPEPLSAAADAVNQGSFDEIIVSTLPSRVSRWLHVDLPHKLTGLGLPVTTVTAEGTEKLGEKGSSRLSPFS
jgi:hypothetical protein